MYVRTSGEVTSFKSIQHQGYMPNLVENCEQLLCLHTALIFVPRANMPAPLRQAPKKCTRTITTNFYYWVISKATVADLL